MSGKKQAVELRPQSQFFAAPNVRCQSEKLHHRVHVAEAAAVAKVDSVSIRDVLRSKLDERKKASEEAKARGDDEWDDSQFVQLDRETSEHVKSLIEQSDAIK
ncbi:hypothetical protein LPJ73_004717, partial [Coemansia sp. RSA 2703]